RNIPKLELSRTVHRQLHVVLKSDRPDWTCRRRRDLTHQCACSPPPDRNRTRTAGREQRTVAIEYDASEAARELGERERPLQPPGPHVPDVDCRTPPRNARNPVAIRAEGQLSNRLDALPRPETRRLNVRHSAAGRYIPYANCVPQRCGHKRSIAREHD